jgi:hypothetical protein
VRGGVDDLIAFEDGARDAQRRRVCTGAIEREEIEGAAASEVARRICLDVVDEAIRFELGQGAFAGVERDGGFLFERVLFDHEVAQHQAVACAFQGTPFDARSFKTGGHAALAFDRDIGRRGQLEGAFRSS